jgi:hypothetical protein
LVAPRLYTGRGKHAKKIFFVKPKMHYPNRRTDKILEAFVLPKDVFTPALIPAFSPRRR